eukprot:scaffold26186_cov30-Tisochrysis_lutea.AAC.5
MRDALRRSNPAIEELEMQDEDMAHFGGRGPPCLFCAHTCHFSFVQVSCTYPRASLASSGAWCSASKVFSAPSHLIHSQMGTERSSKRRQQLVCLRHADSLPSVGRVLFVRYTDDELREICAPPSPATLSHAKDPTKEQPLAVTSAEPPPYMAMFAFLQKRTEEPLPEATLPPPAPLAGLEVPPKLPESLARAISEREAMMDVKRQRLAARVAAGKDE